MREFGYLCFAIICVVLLAFALVGMVYVFTNEDSPMRDRNASIRDIRKLEERLDRIEQLLVSDR